MNGDLNVILECEERRVSVRFFQVHGLVLDCKPCKIMTSPFESSKIRQNSELFVPGSKLTDNALEPGEVVNPAKSVTVSGKIAHTPEIYTLDARLSEVDI